MTDTRVTNTPPNSSFALPRPAYRMRNVLLQLSSFCISHGKYSQKATKYHEQLDYVGA